MKRIVKVVLVAALVVASLISFPAFVHWVAGIWAIAALVAVWLNKSCWPWLLGIALILITKRLGLTVEFLLLIGSFGVIALHDWRRGKTESFKWRRLGIYAGTLLSAIGLYGASRYLSGNTSQQLILDERPIACLGDSLTDFGYPEELKKLISVPVADFGVDGITTSDGIKMIPEILSANPQLVVIELGGHDYNSPKSSRSVTKRNLIQLIESFLRNEIGVILVEIPRGFVSDPYDGLERELARQYDLQLIDDSIIRSFIFNSPILPPGIWMNAERQYSNDGLHPNDLGNQKFAETVRDALRKVFGEPIDAKRKSS